MQIVFFGTPQFAVPSLERLIGHPDIDVRAVVTQPDKRRGRGTQLTPSPVKAVALAHQIPVWQPRSVKRHAETLEKLRQTQSDAFVVVAYGQILSQEILDMPRWGCINGHGSLLPAYRGAAPIQWCLYHGETETGITTMLMDAGMDTGAMLLKGAIAIHLLDNALELAQSLSLMAADLLVDTLFGLQNQTLEPVPQDNEAATYAPLIRKEDYQLDWNRAAIALHNQVRGFYPNCVTSFRNQSLKVKATIPFDGVHEATLSSTWEPVRQEVAALLAQISDQPTPGTVVGHLKNQGALVQTGNGLLLLQEVQLAGKRSQSGSDFVNGMRVEPGEQMG